MSLIMVVDDDQSVREAMHGLLRSAGYAVETVASPQAFLEARAWERSSCLILDVRMPGLSGLELWSDLQRRGVAVPVVFITAFGDEATRRGLLDKGAIACLTKPFGEEVLLEAVGRALGDGPERAR